MKLTIKKWLNEISITADDPKVLLELRAVILGWMEAKTDNEYLVTWDSRAEAPAQAEEKKPASQPTIIGFPPSSGCDPDEEPPLVPDRRVRQSDEFCPACFQPYKAHTINGDLVTCPARPPSQAAGSCGICEKMFPLELLCGGICPSCGSSIAQTAAESAANFKAHIKEGLRPEREQANPRVTCHRGPQPPNPHLKSGPRPDEHQFNKAG